MKSEAVSPSKIETYAQPAASEQWQDVGKPTERVLAVYTTLCKSGPMSLKELCDKLALPKVSAWRAIKVLEGFSLVSVRNQDSRYFVSNVAIRLVQTALDSCDYTGVDMSNLFKLIDNSRYGIAFGTIASQDQFEMFDSSRGMSISDIAPVALGHGLYTTALSKTPISQQLKIIERQFSQIKNIEDVVTMRTALEKDLNLLSKQGFIEQADHFCFFSARTPLGMSLAFAVEIWPRHARTPNAIRTVASNFAQILHEKGLRDLPSGLLRHGRKEESHQSPSALPSLSLRSLG